MKRFFVLLLSVFLLSGCFYSKEARQLKKDPEIQSEIESLIKEHGEDMYGMELHPNMKKMKFAITGKFPWPTDKIVVVPVKTTGDPEFQFNTYVHIYNEQTEKYEVTYDSIDISELDKIGPFLLEITFMKLHQEAFSNLKKVDQGIKIKRTDIEAVFNQHFEDKEQERTLKKAFAEDYMEGKFTDPTEYERLINTHMTPWHRHKKEGWQCEPTIRLEVRPPLDESETSEEKIRGIIEYIESADDLPQGIYTISLDSQEEYIYESISMCND